MYRVQNIDTNEILNLTQEEYDAFCLAKGVTKNKMKKTTKSYTGNDPRHHTHRWKLLDNEPDIVKCGKCGGETGINNLIFDGQDWNCSDCSPILKDLKNICGDANDVTSKLNVGNINVRVDFSEPEGLKYHLTSKTINTKAKNILAISDIHLPFCLDGYLEFCIKIKEKYNCETIVIMGDLLDNNAMSYWDSDPDGMSAGQELRSVKEEIKKWYKAFPDAYVIYGNHTILPYRKAFSSGMSKHWIKEMKDVLDTPSWIFGEEFIINNILFYHGEGVNPKTKAVTEMMSVVGAHAHSQSYIEFFQGRLPNTRVFGMRVGCGVDVKSYAMAYGKHNKAPHINVGVIADGVPIIEYMDI